MFSFELCTPRPCSFRCCLGSAVDTQGFPLIPKTLQHTTLSLAFVRTKSLLRCFHVCPLFVLSFLSASTVFSCTSADFSKSYSFIFVYTRRLTSLVVVVVGSIHHSSAQIYRSPSLFHTEQLVVRCSTQQRTGRTTMHNKHTEQFRENPA